MRTLFRRVFVPSAKFLVGRAWTGLICPRLEAVERGDES